MSERFGPQNAQYSLHSSPPRQFSRQNAVFLLQVGYLVFADTGLAQDFPINFFNQ